MMAEQLKGQVAILTGASRGIGFAIAQAFAAEDIAVALVARSEAAVRTASETIQRMGRRAIALPAVRRPRATFRRGAVDPPPSLAAPDPRCILRVMLRTRWSAEAWSVIRIEFRRALALRSEIRRAGWFDRGGEAMIRLARRASLLIAFSLLTSATTAYAECAWALWQMEDTRVRLRHGPSK
jgi:hypothetical protein